MSERRGEIAVSFIPDPGGSFITVDIQEGFGAGQAG